MQDKPNTCAYICRDSPLVITTRAYANSCTWEHSVWLLSLLSNWYQQCVTNHMPCGQVHELPQAIVVMTERVH